MPVYMIALNNILDKDAWDEYHKAMPPLIISHQVKPRSGGAFVKRLEGDDGLTCDYLGFLEFRDWDHVNGFLNSPEYKALLPLANRATKRTIFAFEELPIGVS